MSKSPITTHILDTSRGRPAEGVLVELDLYQDGEWTRLGQGHTDADGRVANFGFDALSAGTHRLMFHVGAYQRAQQTTGFYPEVPIIFEVRATDEHYHVPLLLNPFGYSTYRGS